MTSTTYTSVYTKQSSVCQTDVQVFQIFIHTTNAISFHTIFIIVFIVPENQ